MAASDAAEQVFDEWRTARMNRRYFESRLAKEVRTGKILDVITVIATSIVGVGIWFTPANDEVAAIAKVLAVVAAAASIYQLITKPGECAAALEAHVAVYEQLDAALAALVRRIRARNYDETVLDDMEDAKRALYAVQLRRVDPRPDPTLLSAAYDRAALEIPAGYFS